MIEVNLIPGGRKKRSGPAFNLRLPSLGGVDLDKFVVGAALVVLLSLAGMAYLYLGTSAQLEEVAVELEAQVQDSARFATLLEDTDALTARRDSILERIAVIQEIDQGRYTWPHLLDEIARALPEYTWLTAINEVSDFPQFEVQIDGAAGDNTALTTFMNRLESSPFLRGVRLINSSLTVEQQQNSTSRYYLFQVSLVYEQPEDELIETIPLFEGGGSGANAETSAPEPGTAQATSDAVASAGTGGDGWR